MTIKSTLMGYVRKLRAEPQQIQITVAKKEFNNATVWDSPSGEKFVKLTINTESLQKIINDEKEVASVVHLD